MKSEPNAARTRLRWPWVLGAGLLVLAIWATLMLAWGLWIAAQQGWHQGWNGGMWQGWASGWEGMFAGLGFGDASWRLQQASQSLQALWDALLDRLSLQPWAGAIHVESTLWWLWAAAGLVVLWLLAGSLLWVLFWLIVGLILLPLLLVVGALAATVALAGLLLMPLLLVLAGATWLWLLLRKPARLKGAA